MRPILHQIRVPSLPRRRRVWPSGSSAPVSSTALGFTIERVPATTYSTLRNAIDAAIGGDVIVGVPGTYIPELVAGYDFGTPVTKSLTIRSSVAGQKCVIDATSVSHPGGGSIMSVSSGMSLTLEDFELRGNKHQDNYNAGLSTGTNTGTVTLRRVKIEECSNGVFNSNLDSTCVMTLEDCELANNGTSSGYYHNMYIGNIAALTLRGCWIHNTKTRDDYNAEYGAGNTWRESGGHLVKSRARATTVEASRVTMEVQSATWGANRCFDISNGGDLTIRGCLIEYRTGQNSGSGQAVAWGPEGSVNLPGDSFEPSRAFKFKVQQNTIVARSNFIDSTTNKNVFWLAVGQYGFDGTDTGNDPIPAPSEFSISDNIFCGWIDTPPTVREGPAQSISTTYAISLGSNTCGTTALLTDAGAYDYTPLTPVTGSQNWAPSAYVHPTSRVPRDDLVRGGVKHASIPAWVPVASSSLGMWGQVSTNIAGDPLVVGDFGTRFPNTRNLDQLFTDYTGTFFNRYVGTYGAYVLHGGGHDAYLGNEVYAWMVDTQVWQRLSDPVYPGDLPTEDWVLGHTPTASIIVTYGELTAEVPASNHSRWLMNTIPPANGGGAQGSMLLPRLSSLHTNGTLSVPWPHRFDFNAALTTGPSGANAAWSRYAPAADTILTGTGNTGACFDTINTYSYTCNQTQLSRYNPSNTTYTNVTPSGWSTFCVGGSDPSYTVMLFAPTISAFLVMRNDFAFRVVAAASGALTLSNPGTPNGTPPTGVGGGSEDHGMTWCEHLGTNGGFVWFDHRNNAVRACIAPASPLSQPWTWTTLAASNSPSVGNAIHWYSRMQYAPAIKAFLIAGLAEGSLSSGGMWCFRPSLTDIPA
jgi:hypothetical protein